MVWGEAKKAAAFSIKSGAKFFFGLGLRR